VRTALCVTDVTTREAIARALERNGGFEVVSRVASAAELADVVHTQLPDVFVVDATVGGGDVQRTLSEISAGRPFRALVLVDDERPAAHRGRSQTRGTSMAYLPKTKLLGAGLAAKSHVSRCLSELAESDDLSRHTIPTDLLVETVERRQTLAGEVGIRDAVTTLGTWPLDLILLVGGTGNEGLVTDLVRYVNDLPVPVLVAMRPYASLEPATWRDAQVLVRQLDGPVNLRLAEGFLVAPRHGQVRLAPDAISVTPGLHPLSVADLIRSTGALQSGALTILLSDKETDSANALVAAMNAGAVGAVLDPASCTRADGVEAALELGGELARLSIPELRWLLANAVPRRN
jgi:hypothetical protein